MAHNFKVRSFKNGNLKLIVMIQDDFKDLETSLWQGQGWEHGSIANICSYINEQQRIHYRLALVMNSDTLENAYLSVLGRNMVFGTNSNDHL